MRKRKYNKVDIIQGITKDEGGMDLLLDYFHPERKRNLKENFEYFGPISLFLQDEDNSLELTKQVYQYYLNRKDIVITEDDWKEIVDLNSDVMFRVGHDIVANFFASDQDIKFYSYQLDHFAQVSFTTLFPGFIRRDVISHGDDGIYLFHGGELFSQHLQNEDDIKMRHSFLKLWTNFARTGDPTPSGSDFKWEEATSDSFRYLSLTTSPIMKDDTFQKNRKFWSTLKTSQNLNLQRSLKEEL
ncbi:hypothetical protein Avbf_12603 [Armadillidium vulgare]|nr:hypothetical protein Avbf_12603 [Armadillidium vulgare]